MEWLFRPTAECVVEFAGFVVSPGIGLVVIAPVPLEFEPVPELVPVPVLVPVLAPDEPVLVPGVTAPPPVIRGVGVNGVVDPGL